MREVRKHLPLVTRHNTLVSLAIPLRLISRGRIPDVESHPDKSMSVARLPQARGPWRLVPWAPELGSPDPVAKLGGWPWGFVSPCISTNRSLSYKTRSHRHKHIFSCPVCLAKRAVGKSLRCCRDYISRETLCMRHHARQRTPAVILPAATGDNLSICVVSVVHSWHPLTPTKLSDTAMPTGEAVLTQDHSGFSR